jgi:predicted ferric reductase
MGNESNKMTAVQWFIEQLEQKGVALENVSIRRIQISVDVSQYLDLKRQAKQMEKEQIKDAYFIGGHDIQNNRYRGMHEYYNETYGGNK